MIRLAISVEGQTEEEFVNSVLAPHLRPMAVEPTPILIGRARNRGAGGGDVSVERLASEMVSLSWRFDAVTSLVDFYGFRGKGDRTVRELEQNLDQQVQAKAPRLDQRMLFSYVQQYEFEGLLFSDVQAFKSIGAPEQSILRLGGVRSRFPTPEEIDDSPSTAPSKRIAGAVVKYRKRLHGPIVAKETGLDVIREECPRFREWVSRMESLGCQG